MGSAARLVLRSVEDLAAAPPAKGLSSDTTLSEFFERYFLPVYARSQMLSPATVAEYHTSIRLWKQFVWDPPLRLIDNAACAAFIYEDLNREDGTPISPNTVRGHCTELQMVLNGAGPQNKDCPWAATPYGLFGDDPFGRPRSAPWFLKPPEREKPAEDGLSLPEIGRVLAACQRAEKPILSECTPVQWWQGLVRFGYNTGLRRKGLLALRRTWITRFGEAGLLALPGRASKKNRPKQIYCSAEALAVLEQIPTGEQVFPWLESLVSFDRYRRKIWQWAGVPADKTFHGIRKAIGSELWRIDPKAAQRQLGHESEATTRRSYVSMESAAASLAEIVGPASRRVRQPKVAGDRQQRMLFER